MIPTPYLGMLRKAGIQAAETNDYIISAPPAPTVQCPRSST